MPVSVEAFRGRSFAAESFGRAYAFRGVDPLSACQAASHSGPKDGST
jgi:hypothetical protein